MSRISEPEKRAQNGPFWARVKCILSHRTPNVCNFFPHQAHSRSLSTLHTPISSKRVHESPTKNSEICPLRCQLRCQKSKAQPTSPRILNWLYKPYYEHKKTASISEDAGRSAKITSHSSVTARNLRSKSSIARPCMPGNTCP